jgi:hypothetical protein
MLFGQAAFLAGSIIYFVRSIDWAREATYVIFSLHAQDTAIFTVLFSCITVATFLTATGISLRWPGAWLMAMGLQGLILAYCLGIYFFTTSYLRTAHLLYLIMLYSIILALYLNSTDVRLAFFPKLPPANTWSGATVHPPRPEQPDERPDA